MWSKRIERKVEQHESINFNISPSLMIEEIKHSLVPRKSRVVWIRYPCVLFWSTNVNYQLVFFKLSHIFTIIAARIISWLRQSTNLWFSIYLDINICDGCPLVSSINFDFDTASRVRIEPSISSTSPARHSMLLLLFNNLSRQLQ